MSVYHDIFGAANNGTVDDVKYFIEEKGVNVNTRKNENSIHNGETALHVAAYYGKVEIVKYLISKGANVNARSDVGVTPLHNAATDTGHAEHDTGKLDVAKILISEGADVNAKFSDNLTPLELAKAGRTRTEIVEYIESAGGYCTTSDEEETSPESYEVETAKKEIKIILISAIIGAIIFYIIFPSIFFEMKNIYEVLMCIWIGIGLGGNISLIPFFFRIGLNTSDSILHSIGMGILSVLFLWFIASSFAGPIWPLIRILIKIYEIKKAQ
jgi:hypothetical protein